MSDDMGAGRMPDSEVVQLAGRQPLELKIGVRDPASEPQGLIAIGQG
jgi:hypothetical protein